MLMSTLYFLVKLDSVKEFALIVFWVLVIALLVILFIHMIRSLNTSNMSYRDPEEGQTKTELYNKIKKEAIAHTFKIGIPASIILLFALMLPSTKEAAFIYVVHNISTNEDAKRLGKKIAIDIPEKALQILEQKCDEYLGEQKTKETISQNK